MLKNVSHVDLQPFVAILSICRLNFWCTDETKIAIPYVWQPLTHQSTRNLGGDGRVFVPWPSISHNREGWGHCFWGPILFFNVIRHRLFNELNSFTSSVTFRSVLLKCVGTLLRSNPQRVINVQYTFVFIIQWNIPFLR